MEFKEATKTKCCCNCEHDIREKDAKGMVIRNTCEIDGHYIGYLACFGLRCDHWKLDPWQRKSKRKQKGE